MGRAGGGSYVAVFWESSAPMGAMETWSSISMILTVVLSDLLKCDDHFSNTPDWVGKMDELYPAGLWCGERSLNIR